MIRVELSQTDMNDLAALMDAGVKAIGLPSVKQAAALLSKLEAAVAAANAPKLEPQEND